MRVLVAAPPSIPSYFNAGHHLPIFLVAAYLRSSPNVSQVTARDWSALNATWKTVCRDLAETRFDVVAIFNDFDFVDGIERLVYYVREFQPDAKFVTFGRGSKLAPKAFEGRGLDAIVVSGDYESGVQNYVDFLSGRGSAAGLRVRDGESYRVHLPGQYLEADKWVLPDVLEIPYDAYDALYSDDLNKFCGIPDCRELVVPVARGCPVNCDFCDVPKMQGLRERRLSVEATVRYISRATQARHFDYIAFYAPTFTLKRNWVLDLCRAMSDAALSVPWKCTTTLAHLDIELLQAMARSGCIRVSVGVETLEVEGLSQMPVLKSDPEQRLDAIAGQCQALGIELNAFIMVGLPDETPDEAKQTIQKLRALKARVRPTVYTPYQELSDATELRRFDFYNRQLLPASVTARDKAAYYRILYADRDDKATAVGERILTAQASVFAPV